MHNFWNGLMTFAVQRCIDTALFGQICDDCHGGSIYKILALGVNILSMGIGILGVLEITVAGVSYLTSSGDSAKMAKAKRRIMEVAIGLVAYGVMYAFLQWLLPGGLLNGNITGSTNDCPVEIEPTQTTTGGASGSVAETTNTQSTSSSPSPSSTTSTSTSSQSSSKASLLATTAVSLAWPYNSGANAGKCKTTAGKLVNYNRNDKSCAASLKEENAAMLKSLYGSAKVSRAQDCSYFIGDLIKYTKVDSSFPTSGSAAEYNYLVKQSKKSNGKWIEIPNNGSTKNLKPGDIFVYPRIGSTAGHVMIYVGNNGYGGNMIGASLKKWVARTHNVYFKHTSSGNKFKIFRLRE